MCSHTRSRRPRAAARRPGGAAATGEGGSEGAGQRGGKRDQIVAAALVVFSRDGFHEAKMEDVAMEAGVGKGTLYLYFRGKDELLRHILRHAADCFVDGLRAIAGGEGTAHAKLCAMARFMFDFSDQHQAMARVALEGLTGLRKEMAASLLAVRRDVLDAFRTIVAAGVSRGELRAVDPGLAAHLCLGTLQSLMAPFSAEEGAAQRGDGDLAEAAVDLVWHALAP